MYAVNLTTVLLFVVLCSNMEVPYVFAVDVCIYTSVSTQFYTHDLWFFFSLYKKFYPVHSNIFITVSREIGLTFVRQMKMLQLTREKIITACVYVCLSHLTYTLHAIKCSVHIWVATTRLVKIPAGYVSPTVRQHNPACWRCFCRYIYICVLIFIFPLVFLFSCIYSYYYFLANFFCQCLLHFGMLLVCYFVELVTFLAFYTLLPFRFLLFFTFSYKFSFIHFFIRLLPFVLFVFISLLCFLWFFSLLLLPVYELLPVVLVTKIRKIYFNNVKVDVDMIMHMCMLVSIYICMHIHIGLRSHTLTQGFKPCGSFLCKYTFSWPAIFPKAGC